MEKEQPFGQKLEFGRRTERIYKANETLYNEAMRP